MGNQIDGSERREFKRVAIPSSDGIMGYIRSPRIKADDTIPVNIVDLSAGGLHFFVLRGSFKEINVGDDLILREIKGTKELEFISNVELEVKWIAEHPFLKHVGLGCKFLNISDEIRQQIDQFIIIMRQLRC